jgi:hypothetical protein
MIRRKRSFQKGEFWIARHQLARGQASRFYDNLDENLAKIDSAAQVHGTTGDQMAAHRKLDQRRVYRCAGALRKPRCS